MREPTLTANARKIMDLRYSRRDEDGNPTENPAEIIERVAWNVAAPSALYVEEMPVGEVRHFDPDTFPYSTAYRHYRWMREHGLLDHPVFRDVMLRGWLSVERIAEEYQEMLTDLLFLPNSPTFTGAGTPLGQYAACFVLPVADDLVEGRDSIFETLRVAAAIQQTGGGNGFCFSDLRPEGWIVKRSMGTATGPVGFMAGYSHSFFTIAQGGARKGANMATFLVSHPDIRKFINCKSSEGDIDQFNISVMLTDHFMQAVEKDTDFDLHFNNQGGELVRARDLMREIAQHAWENGEPGTLFIDRAERDNPCPTHYRYTATNPCGEQWLPPYGSCNLGSIAVQRFVEHPYTYGEHGGNEHGITYGVFNWDRFADTIRMATRFLDDVIDANQYVPSVPELAEMGESERRIGLGLMGLGDAMALMGLRYGSPEALDFASQVMEFVRYHAMLQSIERAEERGPFPWITNSIYDPNIIGTTAMRQTDYPSDNITVRGWDIPDGLIQPSIDFDRPELAWQELKDELRIKGLRNATLLTMAPTGTIGNVSDCEAGSGEPFFALTYTRELVQAGAGVILNYANRAFQEALERQGFEGDGLQAVIDKVAANNGSCQSVPEVPAHIRHIFAVAADVTPDEHVWSQAVLQPWVDNSISKTINLPPDATVEDVEHAYVLAHSLGCKGLTVYRQGSREMEILRTTTNPEGKAIPWPKLDPIAIPFYAADQGIDARVFPVETFFGKVQVTITKIEGHYDRPFDVRLQIGKGGNDKNADVEAIGRMISIALRTGTKVEAIVGQLEHIGGQSQHGFGENKVRSVADGVAKLLRRLFMQDDERVTSPVGSSLLEVDTSRTCPECGQTSIITEAGCSHCDVRLGGCGEFTRCD